MNPLDFRTFKSAQSRGQSAEISNYGPATVYSFCDESSRQNIPFMVRTGKDYLGYPSSIKSFRRIEFHGKGKIYCRVYVDGVWILDADVVLTELPSKNRRILLPIGTKGYAIDLEFSGDAEVDFIERQFSIVGGE